MRYALFLALFVLLAHAALADVLTVTMDVYKNDTAFPVYMHLNQKGTPSRFQSKSGLYRLEVLDDSGHVVDVAAANLSFYVLSDPPAPVEDVPFGATLYVNEKSSKLNLYKEEKLLFTYDLPRNQTCRRDGICDADESSLTCPSDCPVQQDRTCTPVQDSVCDYDCPSGADLDCTGFVRHPRPPKPPPDNGLPFALVACAGIFGIAALAICALVAYHLWAHPGKKSGSSAKRQKPGQKR